MLQPLLLLPAAGTGSDASADDGALMRPKQYGLEHSQKPEVYNLQDSLPRTAYSLFLYH
jgi:hypothetical protein